MPRIKVTGYLNTDDMPPEFVDLDSTTGLSEEGFEQIATDEGFPVWKIADLEDQEFEVES